MAEINTSTLYEINKSVMKTQPVMKKKQVEEKKKELKAFFMEKINDKYFMLLCKELSDYTVFIISSTMNCGFAVNELEECLNNRGDILSIERTEDNIAFEIWIKKDEEAFVYYLFPYAKGIIEC